MCDVLRSSHWNICVVDVSEKACVRGVRARRAGGGTATGVVTGGHGERDRLWKFGAGWGVCVRVCGGR